MDKQKRILIPIDGSYFCQKAFQWVLKNLYKTNDIVIFVHVVEPPSLKSMTLKSGINIPVDELSKKIKHRLVLFVIVIYFRVYIASSVYFLQCYQ